MGRAVIVGGGLGGLGAGIHLLRQGWSVTLHERNPIPGGRMHRISEEGYQIDTGPTLLMMPEVIERLFTDCGRRMEDYLKIRRLDPSYEIRFGDGSRLPMGRPEDAARHFEAFNAEDARRLPELLEDMRRRYKLARHKFIERPFNTLGDLLHPTSLTGFAQAMPIHSVWNYISGYVRDERLRQALTFQTLYLGTSPYQCPSMYGFLPLIEMEFGVWFPEGGMYAVAQALTRLFQELGGRIECGSDVREIRVNGGRADGVVLGDGRVEHADVVVSNCDVQTTYTRLLGKQRRRVNSDSRIAAKQSGCSGYLLYLGVKRVPDDWGHHTVALPADYAGTLDDMFRQGRLPQKPAVYACVPSRTDPTLAPEGRHVLYVLAPVPHLNPSVDWSTEAPVFRERCLDALETAGWHGIRDDIVFERSWNPETFQEKFGLFRGSAFGLACSFMQSAYFRPHNRSEDIPGLYLVGASTHPGGGVPIVLTSARLVADTVVADAAVRKRRRGWTAPHSAPQTVSENRQSVHGGVGG